MDRRKVLVTLGAQRLPRVGDFLTKNIYTVLQANAVALHSILTVLPYSLIEVSLPHKKESRRGAMVHTFVRHHAWLEHCTRPTGGVGAGVGSSNLYKKTG